MCFAPALGKVQCFGAQGIDKAKWAGGRQVLFHRASSSFPLQLIVGAKSGCALRGFAMKNQFGLGLWVFAPSYLNRLEETFSKTVPELEK